MIEILKRAFFIWIGLFILAFLNGALREIGIKSIIDEPWAHRISALTATLIFYTYVAAVWSKSGIQTKEQAVVVGLAWFALTLVTETIVLNLWISKLSWEQILETFNITKGELWPFVLVWIALLPSVLRVIRGPAL